MKRPSYRAAVLWIALNDAPGDSPTAEDMKGFLTVALVSDLFGINAEIVARDVLRQRAGGAQSDTGAGHA